MPSFLFPYRYVTFVLSIICGVVICSIAAWDLSIVKAVQVLPGLVQVELAIIATNAAVLLLLFPILILDALRKRSFLSWIWFECLWTAILSLFQLAGAVALTATAPSVVCAPQASALDLCLPVKALMAFTWIQTFSTLTYFCVFASTVIRHSRDDPKVWLGTILDYPWFAVRISLDSESSYPSKPKVVEADRNAKSGTILARISFASRVVARQQHDLEKQLSDRRDAAAPTPQVSQHRKSKSMSARPAFASKPSRRGKGSLGNFRPPPLDLTLAHAYGKP